MLPAGSFRGLANPPGILPLLRFAKNDGGLLLARRRFGSRHSSHILCISHLKRECSCTPTPMVKAELTSAGCAPALQLKNELNKCSFPSPHKSQTEIYTRMAVSERTATRVGKHSRRETTKLTPIFHSSAAQKA